MKDTDDNLEYLTSVLNAIISGIEKLSEKIEPIVRDNSDLKRDLYSLKESQVISRENQKNFEKRLDKQDKEMEEQSKNIKTIMEVLIAGSTERLSLVQEVKDLKDFKFNTNLLLNGTQDKPGLVNQLKTLQTERQLEIKKRQDEELEKEKNKEKHKDGFRYWLGILLVILGTIIIPFLVAWITTRSSK